jgi:hypothetical protein
MPPIGDLDRFGGSFAGPLAVVFPPVPTDDLYLWMLREPSAKGLFAPLRKEIYRSPANQVAEDSPIGRSFAKSEVINPQDARAWRRFRAPTTQEAEQAIAAGHHAEAIG